MTWAHLCVDLCIALLACASVVFVIVTAERMRAPTSEAEQKAHALLRAWFSPEQAQQYKSQKHFDVIGSDTGTRYRIRHGCMVNIDQLDSAGNRVCVWCVVPEGNLAASDCMLTQKIALETFETKALAIAVQRLGLVQYVREWRAALDLSCGSAARGNELMSDILAWISQTPSVYGAV